MHLKPLYVSELPACPPVWAPRFTEYTYTFTFKVIPLLITRFVPLVCERVMACPRLSPEAKNVRKPMAITAVTGSRGSLGDSMTQINSRYRRHFLPLCDAFSRPHLVLTSRSCHRFRVQSRRHWFPRSRRQAKRRAVVIGRNGCGVWSQRIVRSQTGPFCTI